VSTTDAARLTRSDWRAPTGMGGLSGRDRVRNDHGPPDWHEGGRGAGAERVEPGPFSEPVFGRVLPGPVFGRARSRAQGPAEAAFAGGCR